MKPFSVILRRGDYVLFSGIVYAKGVQEAVEEARTQASVLKWNIRAEVQEVKVGKVEEVWIDET